MKRLFFFFLLFGTLLAADASYIKQVEQLIQQRKFEQAVKILESHQTESDALYYLSVIKLVRGNIDQALDLANKGLEIARDKDRFYEWLGDIYAVKAQTANMFSAMMTISKIKKNWQKAIAFNPDNLNVKEKLFMFYLMAPGIAGGDEKQALKLAKEISAKDTVRYQLMMGRYHQKKKDLVRAEEAYQIAFQLAPDSVNVLRELAMFYMNQKQFDKARPFVTRMIELKPDAASGYDLFGDFYARQENFDSALAQYDHALKIEPYQYRIEFKKAQILAKLNRKEEARTIAQKLLNEEIFFTMKKQIENFLDEL